MALVGPACSSTPGDPTNQPICSLGNFPSNPPSSGGSGIIVTYSGAPATPTPTGGGKNYLSGFENLMHTVGQWAVQLGKDVVTSTVAAGIVEAAKKYGPAALKQAGQLWSTATSPAGQAAVESQLNAESPGLGTAMNDLSLAAGSPTGVQLYQLIQNGLGEVGTIVDSLQ